MRVVFESLAVFGNCCEWSPASQDSAPIQPLPPVMTTEEVAKVLRCSEATVERYVFSHQLGAIKIGRERRFRADDVLDFIAARPTTARIGRNGLRRGAAD